MERDTEETLRFERVGSMKITVRPEAEQDYRQVEELTREAFSDPGRLSRGGIGCPFEHWIVHELRGRDGVGISLVAQVNRTVVGHLICSRAWITMPDSQDIPVISFGPVSVLPRYQRKGVGKALMNAMMEEARRRGHGAILFFGHPGYYPRFGFTEAARFGVTDRFGGNFPAFMAMELIPGYLAAAKGGRFEGSDLYDEERHKAEVMAFDRSF